MELIEGEDLAARLRRGGRLVRGAGGSDRPRRRAGARRRAHPRDRPSRRQARATSCSRATAGRWSPTSGSPGWRPTPRARSRARPSAPSTTSARSRRAARRRRPALRRLQPRPGAVRGADRQRAWTGEIDRAPSPRSGSVPTRRRRARSAPRSRPPSTRSSSGRSIRTRRVGSRTAAAMAAALEPIVSRPDASEPDRRGRSAIVAGEPAPRSDRRAAPAAASPVATAAARRHVRAPRVRPPARVAASSRSGRRGRRWSASRGDRRRRVLVAVAAWRRSARSRRAEASQALPHADAGRPTAPEPTPDADRPRASPTPTPTPSPEAPTEPPGRGARDLCDPILGFPCGLESRDLRAVALRAVVPIRAPRRLVDLALGADLDRARPARRAGLTFASGLIATSTRTATRRGATLAARDLVESVHRDRWGRPPASPHDIRVDERRATRRPTSPRSDADRVALFGTSTQTYFLEPTGRPGSSSSTARMADDRARHRTARGSRPRGDPRRRRPGRPARIRFR